MEKEEKLTKDDPPPSIPDFHINLRPPFPPWKNIIQVGHKVRTWDKSPIIIFSLFHTSNPVLGESKRPLRLRQQEQNLLSRPRTIDAPIQWERLRTEWPHTLGVGMQLQRDIPIALCGRGKDAQSLICRKDSKYWRYGTKNGIISGYRHDITDPLEVTRTEYC